MCRRNSPRPTALMERASLRLRFMPSTWRSSSTTRAGRTCALAAVACRSRCLICCFLTFRATCSGSVGGSEGLVFLPFLALTLAFGSAETPLNKSRGFLLSFQLSLSCERASSETNKTCKPTNSDAQDVYVSEQTARLSFVDPLACDLRPAPDAAPEGAKQEKWKDTPRRQTSARLTVSRLHSPYSLRGGKTWKYPNRC